MTSPRLLLGCALVLLSVGAAGCGDDVSPTTPTDRAFTFYGYLDPTADRQALRVAPITATLDADLTTIDATVRSTDLTTGETVAWRDSLVTFADGSLGHVFTAAYTPRPGARIRIEATRSDGKVTAVEVDVPPIAGASVSDGLATAVDVFYTVTVTGVPRVLGGNLVLVVDEGPVATGPGTRVEVPLGAIPILEQPAGSGQWTVRIPFVRSVRERLSALGLLGRVRLREARFEAFVANREWAVPPGGFDPDVIVEPGTFTNVTDGFGFVGAGYTTPVTWTPSLATQARAGFAVTNDPAVQLIFNEVGLSGSSAGPFVEFYNPTSEALYVDGYRLTDDPDVITRYTVPSGGGLVPPRGFLSLAVPFPIQFQTTVRLLSPGGVQVKAFVVRDATAGGYGRYPDGAVVEISDDVDYALGATTGTPGGPNALPFSSPVVVNEIYTEGENGFVELRYVPGQYTLPFPAVKVASELTYLAGAPDVDVSSGRGFRPESVPPETNFVLMQEGGVVYVVAQLDGPTSAKINRIVHVRRFGQQTPGFSVGYLPDWPDGPWTVGLTPTRRAPNAPGRPAALWR